MVAWLQFAQLLIGVVVIMPSPSIVCVKSAIDYVNYHYYSCPMDQFNVGEIVLPCPPYLSTVTASSGREYKIRISHGLLHALAAMEVIDHIVSAYKKHIPTWDVQFKQLSDELAVTEQTLVELIKIAALFHDSARKGDGQDLWDAESGTACYEYLTKHAGVDPLVAERIADTVRYKDDKAHYIEKHGIRFDALRELVNMADTLEVLRCRQHFDPRYLAIFQHIEQHDKKLELIDELVVPHRKRIFDEGRLAGKGGIVFPGYEDKREGLGKTGYHTQKIADAYEAACIKYPNIALLSISSQEEKEEMVRRALRGVETFMEQQRPKLKGSFQFRLFAHDRFAPMLFEPLDYYRAKGIKFFLESESTALDSKVDLILLMSVRVKDTQYSSNIHLIPLNLEVQRSLGHYSNFCVSEDELMSRYLSNRELFALINGNSSALLGLRFNRKLTNKDDHPYGLFSTPHAFLIAHFKGNQAFLDLFDGLNTSSDAKTYHEYMINQSAAIINLAQKDSSHTRCVGLTIALGAALVASAGAMLINPLFATLFLVSVAALLISKARAIQNESRVSSLLTQISSVDVPSFSA